MPTADYKSEVEIGQALSEAVQNGLVKREDLFITTKLWNSDHGHVLEACKDSLKKLKLDYLDLYLVLEQLAVLAVKMVNYDMFLTGDCLAYSKIKPAVNQIETHPYFRRESLVNFSQKHGICVTHHSAVLLLTLKGLVVFLASMFLCSML
ncbi:putative mannose-6-phosphate 6-reductase [Dioscorea sansibarensis]